MLAVLREILKTGVFDDYNIIINNNEAQVKLSKPYQMKLDFEEYV